MTTTATRNKITLPAGRVSEFVAPDGQPERWAYRFATTRWDADVEFKRFASRAFVVNMLRKQSLTGSGTCDWRPVDKAIGRDGWGV